MRLSLMKAAHVALFGTAYGKYGYLPDFGRCGIPRTPIPKLCKLQMAQALRLVARTDLPVEIRRIPHLPKPGRYGAPVIRYG
jgi:hypothetical protein